MHNYQYSSAKAIFHVFIRRNIIMNYNIFMCFSILCDSACKIKNLTNFIEIDSVKIIFFNNLKEHMGFYSLGLHKKPLKRR